MTLSLLFLVKSQVKNFKVALQLLWSQFAPTEKNCFTPGLLRGKSLSVMAGLLLSAQVFVWSYSFLFPVAQAAETEVTEPGVVYFTNLSRSEAKRQPLKTNPLLSQAAQAKAEDMVREKYFAHTSPSGITPWSFFEKTGYKYLIAGENLGLNFENSGQLEKAWMNSPDHKANILNPDFEEIGVGVKKAEIYGREVVFVVQLFGTRSEEDIFLTDIPTPLNYDNFLPNQTLPRQQFAGIFSEEPTIYFSQDKFMLQIKTQHNLERLVLKNQTRGVMFAPKSGNIWEVELAPGQILSGNSVLKIEGYNPGGLKFSKPVMWTNPFDVEANYKVLGAFTEKNQENPLKRIQSFLTNFSLFLGLFLLVLLAINIGIKPYIQNLQVIANTSLVIVFCMLVAY